MEIQYGRHRVAFLTSRYAIKVARLDHLAKGFWFSLRFILRHRSLYLGWNNFIYGAKLSWRGIMENLCELYCWQKTKAPFLAQTYLSLGLFNIQRRLGGDKPTYEFMNRFLSGFGEEANLEFHSLDPHSLEPENFRRDKTSLMLFDYGDQRLVDLIIEHRSEFERLAKLACYGESNYTRNSS